MTATPEREVHAGILHKCGGRIKSWTKRWMVLRSDYCLYYYKDIAKGHLGVISLRDPKFKVRFGERGDISWPKNVQLQNTMAIVTTPRTYFMFAESKAEADEWRKVLEEMHRELVDDTRRKSFSSRTAATMNGRSATVTTGHSADLGSRSVEVRSHAAALSGGRPKAMTSVTDSVTTSNTSSIFGSQFVLSSSSDMDSPFLNSSRHQFHHVDAEREREQEGERERERERGKEGEGEREGTGEGKMDSDHVYCVPPLEADVSGRREGEGEEPERTEGVWMGEDEDEADDYIVPPDAVPSYPQNISVSVGRQEAMVVVPPTSGERDELPKRPESACSLQAIYDLAREVGEEEEEVGGGGYHVIKASDLPPTVGDGGYINLGASPQPPPIPHSVNGKTSARDQPLPAIPASFEDKDFGSKTGGERISLIYEDVPDMLSRERPKPEADYEPVSVDDDHLYSPVEFVEEEEEEEEEGERKKDGSSEAAPSLPPRDHLPPSHPPPPSEREKVAPLPLNLKEEEVPTQHPVSAPRATSRPMPVQLPSNREEESGDQGSGRSPSPHSPLAASPRGSALLPQRFSPPTSPSGLKQQTPVAAPRKSVPSTSSTAFQMEPPSSPIPVPQRRFDRPPSPRSRKSTRPPSPLLSDRRASSSSHSSMSNSPQLSPRLRGREGGRGGDGEAVECDEEIAGMKRSESMSSSEMNHVTSPSQKEKGMALFTRRQHEVAVASEEDSRQRVRSMHMLKGVLDDEALSPEEKALFAETLREVEAERHKASEERFRWERERMQLEDDRKRFELEKQQLRDELERTKQQILQS